MVAITECLPKKSSRHRHRSYGRKAVQSIALVFGMPLLLFAVLAVSVDVIEYTPRAPDLEATQLQSLDRSELRGWEGESKWVLQGSPGY